MREPILVFNAGSSSVKFSVFETGADRTPSVGAHGQVEAIGASARLEIVDAHGGKLLEEPIAATDHTAAIAAIHSWFAAHLGGEAGFQWRWPSRRPWGAHTRYRTGAR
jgi:acetate kinase